MESSPELTNKRRGYSKLYIAADNVTHEIICADLLLRSTTDSSLLLDLINKPHRKIMEASADEAYNARYYQDLILKKNIRHLLRHELEHNINQTAIMNVTTM